MPVEIPDWAIGTTPEWAKEPDWAREEIPAPIYGDESGIPTNISPRERKRLELASQFAAGQAENEKLNAEAESLASQERTYQAFSRPVTTIANLPGRIMAGVGGVLDQYEDIYKPGSKISIPRPTGTNAMAGLGRLGANLAEPLTDPDELLKFAGAANPVGRALFALDMSKHLPHQVEQGAQVAGDISSTPADVVESVGIPVVTAAMLKGLSHTRLPRRGEPGFVADIPEYPGLPDPDLVARNTAAPGTLRPQESQRLAVPEIDAPQMFEAGEVPFERMQRFGGQQLPPVEILPRMGRIENVPILEESRPIEQRETRGKVSFGAEAPTLLREAISKAEEIGLPKAAEAAAEVARGENRMPPYRAPKPATPESVRPNASARRAAVEQGLTMENPPMEPLPLEVDQFPPPVGMPSGTLSRLQSSRIQAGKPNVRNNVRNNPPAPEPIKAVEPVGAAPAEVATTTSLKEAAEIAKRPVSEIEAELAKARAESAAMPKVKPEEIAGMTQQQIAEFLDVRDKVRQDAALKVQALEEGFKAAKAAEPPPTEGGIISGSKAEAWADDILGRDPRTKTRALIDPIEEAKRIAAFGIKGAAIIERGVTDFAKWSEEMIRKHGPEIRDNLKAIYAQSVAFIEREKMGNKQPETREVEGVRNTETIPATPTPEPTPARPVNPDLADIYKIFEPEPVKKPSIGERTKQSYEAVRTGLSSKFRPLNKLAEDIAKQYGGQAKDVAAIFEQVKGSSGKSEADIYRFNEDMKPIAGSEKDFNAYLFLRRGLDRLSQDLADINKAQAGGDVPKLNRRSVGDYTIRDLESKLRTLEQQVGPETLAKFEQAADAYQAHLDKALQLQVSSGRMSPEIYQAIKNGNQFYAPFKMLKYIEQTTRPPGSGSGIQTLADYTKAMTGIESKEFKLGDMLAAARQNLALSRVLAEKNKAMREVAAISNIDADGVFIRRLKPGEDAPKGMADIALLDNGKTERFAVNEAVAQAVKFDEKIGGIIPRMAANIFRFGATVGNIPFQFSNLLADVPRQALVSKFGVQILPDLLLYPFDKYAGKQTNIPKSAVQSLKYPLDLLEAIYSSMVGDVVGPKNKLMLDFLDSGAAGTSIQEYLTPDSLRGTSKPEGVAKKVALAPLRTAMAVEQVSKLTGVKRAMTDRGVESAKDLPAEDVTEIRRFSGSPDFGRIGKWTEKYGLNIAEMFLNARIQGAVADVGRLKGRDGARAAAATWINLSAAVGVPTLLLYLKNHETEGDSQSIDARSEQERKNYWLLPKTNEDGTPAMIQTPQGPIRDYWRIPKRESSKWMANFVEAGMDFSRKKDPETFNKWAVGMLEELSPVNVSGKTFQERGESVLSGLNPVAKLPIEATMGRDTFRHREIIPDSMKKASPEQQFTERTPALFKELAKAVPDVAPELLRSPLMLENMTKNMTAGLITQFLPRKPVEGRGKLENTPLLQRFQALPFLDDSDFDERMKSYERESNDEQLVRFRKAREIADQFKGNTSLYGAVPLLNGDPKLTERVIDLWEADKAGITAKERRIIALPSSERAKYIMDELKSKSPEEKAAIINDLRKKRILTESVAVEMNKLKTP